MLKPIRPKSPSQFEGIYDRIIPEDHFLRKFNNLVDLSFIYDELKDKYCPDNGRNALSLIYLFKYLLLKVIYNMSDVDLVERSRYDLSFKYFLDLHPEDNVIDASTLSKFRKQRLKDPNLLDMLLNESMQIALKNGVIQKKCIIVDATHTKARYNHKSAYQRLLEEAKKLRKVIYQFDSPSRKEHLPTKVENGLLEDALDYCQKLVDYVNQDETLRDIPAVKERFHLLSEIISDDREQLEFSKDPDARIGHKTADSSFFGYKTHMAMTDERIIAAAVVTSGEKGDGLYLQELVEKSRNTGLEVKSVIGDTAYSGKRNLELAESKEAPEQSFELIAKLNPIISNTDRAEGVNGFSYNKDAEMFVCPAGHLATHKYLRHNYSRQENPVMTYYFDVEKCKQCPKAEGCYKEGAKSRSYGVRIKSDLHLKQKDFQETAHFKELAATRYKIEAKNSEIKNRHGYDRASYAGLFGMQIQGATTLFVTNIKRIITLMEQE